MYVLTIAMVSYLVPWLPCFIIQSIPHTATRVSPFKYSLEHTILLWSVTIHFLMNLVSNLLRHRDHSVIPEPRNMHLHSLPMPCIPLTLNVITFIFFSRPNKPRSPSPDLPSENELSLPFCPLLCYNPVLWPSARASQRCQTWQAISFISITF